MNDYNVVEQRNNKSPTHFEKEPFFHPIWDDSVLNMVSCLMWDRTFRFASLLSKL